MIPNNNLEDYVINVDFWRLGLFSAGLHKHVQVWEKSGRPFLMHPQGNPHQFF
jgi:hypothetical protein